jgi:SAM-dependent methyltransferase
VTRRAAPPLEPSLAAYVGSSEIARGYDRDFRDLPLFAYDCLFLEKHLPGSGRVLDLGCGTGRHLAFLASRGHRPVGLDLSPHMLAEAAANSRAGRARPPLVRADLRRLPFPQEPLFDGILLMFSTLGLVMPARSRLELFLSLRSRLSARGRICFHVHNERRARGMHQAIWPRLCGAMHRLAGDLDPGDVYMPRYRGLVGLRVHFFTMEEVESLVREARLRMVALEPLNERRDGPYRGPDPSGEANGFLVAAARS